MTHQQQHEHPHPDSHGYDKLLTIDEVAAILRTPVATLRYWRYLGTGPASFRLGRRVLYRAADLYVWINSQADGDAANAWTRHYRPAE